MSMPCCRAACAACITKTSSLEHCGWEFEPDCLRFHENRRVPQTISSEQVRLPIYKDGLQQWQNFEPWLAPLESALGSVANEYLP
jgi:hypothetical protein